MSLTTLYGDELTLPSTLREKYHLTAGVSVRIIETREGILLIPLTDEPMPAELQEELTDWQKLGASAMTSFPYDESAEKEDQEQKR